MKKKVIMNVNISYSLPKEAQQRFRTMLHIAKEIEYLDIRAYNNLLELSLCISRMLSNFIKKL